MPCSKPNHTHIWPTRGELFIEACERKCGWCDYKTGAANNLRVVSRVRNETRRDEADVLQHAGRHIANEVNLRDISMRAGKKGRSRISSRPEVSSAPQQPLPSEPAPTLPAQTPGSFIDFVHNPSRYSVQHVSVMLDNEVLKSKVQTLEDLLRRHGIIIPHDPSEIDPTIQ
jgi:hypothetical protein